MDNYFEWKFYIDFIMPLLVGGGLIVALFIIFLYMWLKDFFKR
jgi:hypothetical protein